MQEIKTSQELVAVAKRQGMEMSPAEAAVILGYLAGHDYCLLMADDFTMMRHDLTEGDLCCSNIDYDIREAVEFCQEMNDELLLENAAKDEPDEGFLLDLRNDELILDALMKRTEMLIPEALTYMTRERRKNIRSITSQLKKMVDAIEEVLGAEKEYLDNIPESIQGSERHVTTEDAIANLEEAISSLEEAITCLEEAQDE